MTPAGPPKQVAILSSLSGHQEISTAKATGKTQQPTARYLAAILHGLVWCEGSMCVCGYSFSLSRSTSRVMSRQERRLLILSASAGASWSCPGGIFETG